MLRYLKEPLSHSFLTLTVFSLAVLIVALPLLLTVTQQEQISTPHAATNSIPSFSHVFVIIEENHDYSQIIGSSAAPYITQLSNQYGLASNFFAISHPSLPNYIAFTSGSTQGISTDCSPGTNCQSGAANIFSELEGSGKTWKAYQESMPANCEKTNSGNYAVRHNPPAYYTNLKSCNTNDVPYLQFSSDIANGNVGNFNFITPNLQDDMHDGTIQQGDTWLKNELPKILQSQAYQQNGLVVITFDEGQTNGTNQIPTILISPLGKQAFKSSVKYTLYSLLRTICDGLGIQPPGAATTSQDMSDFFAPAGSGSPTLSPSSDPSPTDTSALVTVCPHGLGNCGDNANPHGNGNPSPQHTQRNATITFLNQNNQVVGTQQTTLSYTNAAQDFQGSVTLGNLANGSYLVTIKMDGYLNKQVPGIISFIGSQTNTLPSVPLTTGDINNDNQLDILDYNLLIGCFGSKQTTSSCTAAPTQQSAGADLNDDGKVDGSDYNLFLRELSVQKGSQ